MINHTPPVIPLLPSERLKILAIKLRAGRITPSRAIELAEVEKAFFERQQAEGVFE